MKEYITVVGGGLAGCEAAYQIAKQGIKVKLYEMKPLNFTPAHSNKDLAEIVCSNSFKSNLLTNACGLLKEELRPDYYYPIIQDKNGTFIYSPYIYSCLDMENELDNIDYLIIDLVYDKKFIKGDNHGFLDRNIVYRKGDL